MSANSASESSARDLVSETDLARFFAEVGHRFCVSENLPSVNAAIVPVEEGQLQAFFTSAGKLLELTEARRRVIDRREAGRFNVFDFIEPDENRLSDILAELLDPRGRHGQGDLFLRLLLEQLGIGASGLVTIPIMIRREAPTHGIQKYRRRIDILIDAVALVAIENKVDSLEQPEQVKDYLEHLRYECKDGVRQSILIYLTPNARKPDSLSKTELRAEQACGRLRCWCYREDLRHWLESCRTACESEKVRHFLSDFIAYIGTALSRESESDQPEGSHEH